MQCDGGIHWPEAQLFVIVVSAVGVSGLCVTGSSAGGV